ncbi:MAG: peroxidase-related enzyme [Paracoccaceae bacterium]
MSNTTTPDASGDRVIALDLDRAPLSPETEAYFGKCETRFGFVPNVLQAYAFDETKLRAFSDMYNDLMLGASGLSKLEREMIAVVVSSANRCFYCLTAHGAAVRELSGDPELGELMVMNYRAASLSPRQRAMLDYAWILTTEPHTVDQQDCKALRDEGFSDRDIWDINAVIGFFNMSNRIAIGVDMKPNRPIWVWLADPAKPIVQSDRSNVSAPRYPITHFPSKTAA